MSWLIALALLVSLAPASPVSWLKNRFATVTPAVLDARAAYLAGLRYVPADRREALDRQAALAWAEAASDEIAKNLADEVEAFGREAAEAARIDQRFFAARAARSSYANLLGRYEFIYGSPLTFERVYAPQLARLEARLAKSWGVTLARVQAFVEHALPGEGPSAPRRSWMTAVNDDARSERSVHSEGRQKRLVAEAAAITPEFGELLFSYEPPAARRSAIAGQIGVRFDESGHPLRFSFSPVATEGEAIDQYRGALDAIDRLRARVRRLPASPMKQTLLYDVASLHHEAVDELAQLPLRQNPPADLAKLPLNDPAWWNFGVAEADRPAPLAKAWAQKLIGAGLPSVAGMINLSPPPAATCAPDFDSKSDGDDSPPDDAPRENWPPRSWGIPHRRFGPEWM